MLTNCNCYFSYDEKMHTKITKMAYDGWWWIRERVVKQFFLSYTSHCVFAAESGKKSQDRKSSQLMVQDWVRKAVDPSWPSNFGELHEPENRKAMANEKNDWSHARRGRKNSVIFVQSDEFRAGQLDHPENIVSNAFSCKGFCQQFMDYDRWCG